MPDSALTTEMTVVLALLVLTIFLFVSELVRIDVAAFAVMIVLGTLSVMPGLGTLVDIRDLFDGFASNAVISIIAVMIIGAGLDRTGVMSKVAEWIMRVGGSTEARLIPMISGTVGIISSFMQNVGAAALFLPVVSRISIRTELPMSRLLMPMGFCAILGGTMTMFGSSPLILLNDLIINVNDTLGEAQQIRTFELFDVTPVGLALVTTGILYFVLFGRFVLRGDKSKGAASKRTVSEYFKRLYGLDGTITEIGLPPGSKLVGKTVSDIGNGFNVYVVATHFKGRTRMSPLRDVKLEAPARLALMGSPQAISKLVDVHDLEMSPRLDTFADSLSAAKAGIAELVIPPDSSLIGKSAADIWIRKTYGLSLLAIFRAGESLSRVQTDDHEASPIGKIPFQAGDVLVCHTDWQSLTRLEHDRDFVIVTADYPREIVRPQKVGVAIFFFATAISLILFTDIRLSLCLMIGACGMILGRVLSMDEAYGAVSWSTVFLLASLIPLGQAVQTTGTATWIAQQVLSVLGDVTPWVLQSVIAVMATGFTLVMSNIGATVLLVPLAVNIALAVGADPALFALTVAVATSNSFLIPTHQVNALIMGPAGYKVIDFVRSGGVMTVLFLLVSIPVLNVI